MFVASNRASLDVMAEANSSRRRRRVKGRRRINGSSSRPSNLAVLALQTTLLYAANTAVVTTHPAPSVLQPQEFIRTSTGVPSVNQGTADATEAAPTDVSVTTSSLDDVEATDTAGATAPTDFPDLLDADGSDSDSDDDVDDSVTAPTESLRRSSRRRRPDVTTNTKKNPLIARGVLQERRFALGTAYALCDRILQHKNADGSLPSNLNKCIKK